MRAVKRGRFFLRFTAVFSFLGKKLAVSFFFLYNKLGFLEVFAEI